MTAERCARQREEPPSRSARASVDLCIRCLQEEHKIACQFLEAGRLLWQGARRKKDESRAVVGEVPAQGIHLLPVVWALEARHRIEALRDRQDLARGPILHCGRLVRVDKR